MHFIFNISLYVFVTGSVLSGNFFVLLLIYIPIEETTLQVCICKRSYSSRLRAIPQMLTIPNDFMLQK